MMRARSADARKQNANNDRSVEEIFFRASARVVRSREVVSAKRAAKGCPRLLQKYCGNKKHREDYLYVGENPR